MFCLRLTLLGLPSLNSSCSVVSSQSSGEGCIEPPALNLCNVHRWHQLDVLNGRTFSLQWLPVCVCVCVKSMLILCSNELSWRENLKVELQRVKWGRRPQTLCSPSATAATTAQEQRGSTEYGLNTRSQTNSGNSSHITQYLYLIKILEKFPLYI